MTIPDEIIGKWVRKAEKTGEVEKLPGHGKPLNLEDDSNAPSKYRLSYRILRNAGYAPLEVETIRKVAELKDSLDKRIRSPEREETIAEIRETQQKLAVALDKLRR